MREEKEEEGVGSLIWSWRGLLVANAASPLAGIGSMVLVSATDAEGAAESQTLWQCQVLSATAAKEEDEGKAALCGSVAGGLASSLATRPDGDRRFRFSYSGDVLLQMTSKSVQVPLNRTVCKHNTRGVLTTIKP